MLGDQPSQVPLAHSFKSFGSLRRLFARRQMKSVFLPYSVGMRSHLDAAKDIPLISWMKREQKEAML